MAKTITISPAQIKRMNRNTLKQAMDVVDRLKNKENEQETPDQAFIEKLDKSKETFEKTRTKIAKLWKECVDKKIDLGEATKETISLAELGAKLGRDEKAEGIVLNESLKDKWKSSPNKSQILSKGLLGFGIAEFGLSALGMGGVGGALSTALPAAFNLLSSACTALWSVSPLGTAAMAIGLAIKFAPVIKRLFNKAKGTAEKGLASEVSSLLYNQEKAKEDEFVENIEFDPIEPIKEEPAKEEPAKEEPIKEEPAKEEPIKEEPAKEEPAKEEPVKEEPAKEEPVKEKPAKEEPVKEEPAKEEPAKESPAKEEPAKEEPAKEEPAKEEPAKVNIEDLSPEAQAAVKKLENISLVISEIVASTDQYDKSLKSNNNKTRDILFNLVNKGLKDAGFDTMARDEKENEETQKFIRNIFKESIAQGRKVDRKDTVAWNKVRSQGALDAGQKAIEDFMQKQ